MPRPGFQRNLCAVCIPCCSDDGLCRPDFTSIMRRGFDRSHPPMSFDLTLTPLYRLNGREQASLPGLMANVPPRRAARGRDQDRVVVYLLGTGNAALSTGESVQLASRAAVAFYQTPGTTT